MSGFETYTYGIVIVALASIVWMFLKRWDVFHPFAYLMPMILFLYVYLPAELMREKILDQSVFGEIAHVQLINLLCIGALALGVYLGSRPRKQRLPTSLELPVQRIFIISIILGALALASFAFTVNNVGGFYEAYSREKGGGDADSGYVRDALFLSVPAVAGLALCVANDGLRLKYIFSALLFGAPMVIHGLLGARRGPTFIAIIALAAAYYMGRRKRPSLPVFCIGGIATGFLLILIVTFRGEFRLGSDLFKRPADVLSQMVDRLEKERVDTLDRTVEGDEFIYGASVISRFEYNKDFFWGKRLLTIIFIRPIPKEIWPTKYEDVGMQRYLVNVGLGGVEEGATTVYGAAPGFVADLFAEFSWGAIGAALLVGFAYGRVWLNCVERSGLWLIIYLLMMAFSVFFVLQTLEAVIYRFLFTAIPACIGWWLFVRPKFSVQKHTTPVLQPARST